MKIRIDGTEYDLIEAVQEASTGTIKRMALQSAASGTTVTMDYLEKQRVRLEEMRQDPEVSPLQFGTDVGNLDLLTAYIFMAKAHAGEKISWSEAEDFPPTAIEIVYDDEPATPDEVVEAPKDDAGTSLIDPSL